MKKSLIQRNLDWGEVFIAKNIGQESYTSQSRLRVLLGAVLFDELCGAGLRVERHMRQELRAVQVDTRGTQLVLTAVNYKVWPLIVFCLSVCRKP